MQHRGPVKRRLDLRTRIASGTGDELLAVRLVDTSHQDMIEADQDCTLPAADAPLGSTGFTVRQFLDEWRSGASGLHDAALHFGRSLYAHLFENTPGDVARDWAIVMHEAQGRGLRLELRFPEANAAQWLGQPLAGIPFELLCDHSGFLFRRPGWSTVRRSSRVPSRPLRLHQESEAMPRVLVAWANVAHQGKPFPSTWFEAHDRAVQALADANRATRLSALPDATRRELSRRVQGDKPHVLLWIGHGDHNGSRLVLHDGDDPDFPNDTGQPVEAGDFANAVRRGGVDLALLWSCHGAGPLQPLRAGVAEALLDPNRGDVAAVLASFTAIEASAAADLSAEMIEAWASGPNADLEAALGRAREELNESELTWARPVLFLRTPPATGLSLRPPDAPSPPSPAPDHDLRWLPQLPPRSDRYVDRLQRLATLRSDLNERAIVVLEGLAGLGKTELALAHAHAQRAAGEAVAFVDVTGHRDVSLMSQTLGLLVRERPFETRQDLLAALHGRRWTLVLDNAEDLLDTDDNREDLLNLLDGLRHTGEGFRAVVTSRHALTNEERGETIGLRSRELQPLTAEEAREVFIATAGPRLPAMQATADILDPLLQELGGIARAVVLMAGQLGDGVGVPELRQRLRDAGAEAIVEAGKYGVDIPEAIDENLDKHRLVSAVNLSLRSAAARVSESPDLFDALGAFPAGLAQELLPHDTFPWLTDALGALLEHHLIALGGDEKRVMISAPVRAIAWRRWQRRGDDTGEAGRLLWRLLDAFSKRVLTYRNWIGTARSSAALEALSQEEPNLLHALGLAVSPMIPVSQDWNDVTARMVSAAAVAAEYQGRAADMLPLMNALAKQVEEQRPDAASLAQIWFEIARLRFRTSDLAGTAAAFAVALPIFQKIEDRLGEANTLQGLGDLKVRTNDPEGAAVAYAAALPLYQGTEDPRGEATTLKALGDLKRRTADLKGAADVYATALPLFQKIGDRLGEANTLQSLGQLALAEDRIEQAFAHSLQALFARRSIEDRLGEGASHGYLAQIAVHVGAMDQATGLSGRAFDLFLSIDDRFSQQLCLRTLGLALMPNLPFEGVACLLEAQKIAKTINDPISEWIEDRFNDIREQSDDPEGFSSEIAELRTQSAQIVAAMFAEAEAKVARGELDLYALPVAPTRDESDGGESAAD